MRIKNALINIAQMFLSQDAFPSVSGDGQMQDSCKKIQSELLYCLLKSLAFYLKWIHTPRAAISAIFIRLIRRSRDEDPVTPFFSSDQTNKIAEIADF